MDEVLWEFMDTYVSGELRSEAEACAKLECSSTEHDMQSDYLGYVYALAIEIW